MADSSVGGPLLWPSDEPWPWRRSAEVVHVLADQPEPAVTEDGYYVPEPCVLHPEPVTEYPYGDLLPVKIQATSRKSLSRDRSEGTTSGKLRRS